MLKHIYFTGVALLLLICCFQLVALGENDNISLMLNKIQLNAAPEKAIIQKSIQESNIIKILFQNKEKFKNTPLARVTKQNDLSYGIPYKVIVANAAVANALVSGNNLAGTIISAPYYWEVPVLSKSNSGKAISSFIIDKINGQWQVVEFGAFLSNENIDFSSDISQIKTVLLKNTLDNAQSIYHLRIPAAHQDYLYLSSTNDDSFIPVNHDQLKSKSVKEEKKKITRQELLNQIGKYLK